MRARLPFIPLLACGLSFAGDFDRPAPPTLPRVEGTDRFGFREVVTIEGASAADLQSRARAWIANAYKSANAVVQMDDAGAGTLIAKGFFDVNYLTNTLHLDHTMTIEVKDGRYRYTLTDFVFEGTPYWSGRPLEAWKAATAEGTAKIQGRIATSAQTLVDSLKVAMSRPADDW